GAMLSRTALVESSNRARRYFVWTAHHSVYDGWSLAKMPELLGRLLTGEPLSTQVPVSRFMGYLARQDMEQTKAFWQKHLQDATWARFPSLPSAQHNVSPSSMIQCQLKVPQVAEGVTTSTMLRTAWALLVAASTGANEAVISVVLSGRMATIEGITDLVAPTITSVPFRVCAMRDRSVRDFLADVQKRATEMVPYEHTGLQNIRRMVPNLGPEFDPGHSFVVQPADESESANPIPYADFERSATSTNAFDGYALTVECTMSLEASDVSVEFRYDDAVLPTGNAQRLLAQFNHVVQELA
ncbi:hypothetical protein M409DRAFT_34261, partial [Zasmidium cellare ATCC 36951]